MAPTFPVHSGMARRCARVAVMSPAAAAQSMRPTIAMQASMSDSSLRSKRGSRRQNMSGATAT